jgi:hypothetical protein
METLRSFRIYNFAIVDFIGVMILAEIMMYFSKNTEMSAMKRVVYYIFAFLFGIVVHDMLAVKTQISL